MRALMIAGVILLLVHLAQLYLIPFDDTDAPPVRSGMYHYVDHGTGCEYIAPLFGGLTPRVDATGKHICRKDRDVSQ